MSHAQVVCKTGPSPAPQGPSRLPSARALADGRARGSRANLCWPSCPSARGWTRERLQGKLMLAFLPERSRMDTREAPGQTHAGLPARALADGHARGSRANSCWPSCPSARGRTRERLQGKLMLAFLPERSRMDTREAPGQTHAGLPARALADGHARGSRANSCWPSCPSSRGRTREKVRDEICMHSSSARALADEHARGSRTNFAGRVSLPRALADGHARCSRPRDYCLCCSLEVRNVQYLQHFLPTTPQTFRHVEGEAHAQVGVQELAQLLHHEVLHDLLLQLPENLRESALTQGAKGRTKHQTCGMVIGGTTAESKTTGAGEPR